MTRYSIFLFTIKFTMSLLGNLEALVFTFAESQSKRFEEDSKNTPERVENCEVMPSSGEVTGKGHQEYGCTNEAASSYLSKCSLRDARAPADFQTSAVGEEAEQWEGQTYWGDVSGQGAGGWA